MEHKLQRRVLQDVERLSEERPLNQKAILSALRLLSLLDMPFEVPRRAPRRVRRRPKTDSAHAILPCTGPYALLQHLCHCFGVRP